MSDFFAKNKMFITGQSILNDKSDNRSKELTYHPMNLAYLYDGGLKPDEIKTIDCPLYKQPTLLNSDTMLGIGVTFAGESKFYPLNIMSQHQVCNDKFGRTKVSVTFCPLTRTAVSFKSRRLGTSGRLYNNNTVFYDRDMIHPDETKLIFKDSEVFARFNHSLIIQILRHYIISKRSLNHLVVPTVITTLKDWWLKFPKTSVLVPPQDSNFNYSTDQYHYYHHNNKIRFPLIKSFYQNSLPAKSPSLIVFYGMNKKPRIINYESWDKVPQQIYKLWNTPNNLLARGQGYPIIIQAYWFAMSSFYLGPD